MPLRILTSKLNKLKRLLTNDFDKIIDKLKKISRFGVCMSKKGGVVEAAQLLAGLDNQGRERVLELIEKQNPEMAKTLRDNLITFEDLKYLTPKMLQELLREISLDDLGLALRTSSQELKDFIFNNVSSSLKQDISDNLFGPPQKVTTIEAAIDKILRVVRTKVENGSLVIDKYGHNKYV